MSFFKKVFGGRSEAPPLAASATVQAGPGEVVLVARGRGGTVLLQRALGTGTFSLGRAASCDLPISDASLSRLHARIHVGPDDCAVEDLGSANGVTWGGQRITARTSLSLPATVTVGEVEVELDRSGGSVETATPPSHPDEVPRISAAHASDVQKAQWLELAFGLLAHTFKGRSLPRHDGGGAVESWELQVEIHQRPVRVAVSLGGLLPQLDARLRNQRGYFVLERNPEAVPAQAHPGDAWSDVSRDQRQFFAPGIYASDPGTIAIFQGLEPQARSELVELMNRHLLRTVIVNQDVVSLLATRALSDEASLTRAVGERLRMAVQIADMFEAGAQWTGFAMPPGAQMAQATFGPQAGIHAPIVDCEYCNTSSFFSPSARCPNCGAALRLKR